MLIYSSNQVYVLCKARQVEPGFYCLSDIPIINAINFNSSWNLRTFREQDFNNDNMIVGDVDYERITNLPMCGHFKNDEFVFSDGNHRLTRLAFEFQKNKDIQNFCRSIKVYVKTSTRQIFEFCRLYCEKLSEVNDFFVLEDIAKNERMSGFYL
jgi:hypothetical protein